MAIFNNIEELQQVIKVNNSTPFDSIRPYIYDAIDKYLAPYLGIVIVENLEQDVVVPKYQKLMQRVRRVLGPFSLALGSAELSIRFGDAGHTVTRTDSAAPASDSKIEKADKNLLSRAWQNLEYLLKEMEDNIEDYPEWKESDYYRNRRSDFFESATDFQNKGLIDIEYKRLTFEKLRNLIIRIEKTEVYKLITPSVYNLIFTEVADPDQEVKRKRLLDCICAFIGSRVGEIHTSQTTRSQRSESGVLEYNGIIRPLYEDQKNTGNIYSDQVLFWGNEIVALLPGFGVEDMGTPLQWNAEDRKIMFSEG